jgi:hypothetical protein
MEWDSVVQIILTQDTDKWMPLNSIKVLDSAEYKYFLNG